MKKNRDKISLQKQTKRSIQIKDLVISYVEVESRLKALEETFKINDSESNKIIYKPTLIQGTQEEICYEQN